MNAANRITLVRILLIPIFIFFLMTDFVPFSRYIALGLFLLASATDGVDGYVARKYNQVTDFGKFIDPLADKLLISSALVCMVQFGQIHAVAALIIIAREFMVTSLRLVAISEGKVIAAAMSGKVKMVIQIVVISLVILSMELHWLNAAERLAVDIAVWIMVAVTAYSGIEYMVRNWSVINFKK